MSGTEPASSAHATFPDTMDDVLKTVSELKFRSIAMIAAVILLALAAVWWLLGGSAAPTPNRQPQQASASAQPSTPPAAPVVEEPTQPLAEDPASLEAEPEILVVEGQPSEPLVNAESTSVSPEPEQITGQFTIQVGAFTREAGALKRQSELRSKGYDSSLVEVTEDEGVRYRLLTGSFSTHEEASKTVDQLKLAGIDAFVRSNTE